VLDPSGPCTLTGADHTPFTTRTYHYSRMIALPAGGCARYTNTAATGTGPTSSKTVTVCRLVAGALTIGYWQNKNGQGLIAGDGSTSGVCNSVAFLRQYAPFQDLSSTATCKQVASYVNGVIGVASAAGAAMNAMLKAQMLATALDVYFSTPGLGGNKISAPTPLGGVKIDVTNASAAFGGSTCLSINQLLAYAASQSNVGGGTWYAQNKAVQGLAKDTFDSINNDNEVRSTSVGRPPGWRSNAGCSPRENAVTTTRVSTPGTGDRRGRRVTTSCRWCTAPPISPSCCAASSGCGQATCCCSPTGAVTPTSAWAVLTPGSPTCSAGRSRAVSSSRDSSGVRTSTG
jgi:hypothetical protein